MTLQEGQAEVDQAYDKWPKQARADFHGLVDRESRPMQLRGGPVQFKQVALPEVWATQGDS